MSITLTIVLTREAAMPRILRTVSSIISFAFRNIFHMYHPPKCTGSSQNVLILAKGEPLAVIRAAPHEGNDSIWEGGKQWDFYRNPQITRKIFSFTKAPPSKVSPTEIKDSMEENRSLRGRGMAVLRGIRIGETKKRQ